MYYYKVGDVRKLDLLLQNGVWRNVDYPIASCDYDPTPNYL